MTCTSSQAARGRTVTTDLSLVGGARSVELGERNEDFLRVEGYLSSIIGCHLPPRVLGTKWPITMFERCGRIGNQQIFF